MTRPIAVVAADRSGRQARRRRHRVQRRLRPARSSRPRWPARSAWTRRSRARSQSPWTSVDGASRLIFTPESSRSRAGTTYELLVRASATPTASPSSRPGWRSRPSTAPTVVRFRPADKTRPGRSATRSSRSASPRRWTAPRRRPPSRSRPTASRGRGQGHLRRGRHGPRLRPRQAPARTTRRSWSRSRPRRAERGRRDPRRKAGRGSVPDRGQAQAGRPSSRTSSGSSGRLGRLRQLRRRLGRRRQLGRGRALLPRPHELHPDRRLGRPRRPLRQPGRPQRRPAQAQRRHQLQGRPAVRQAAGDRGECSHFIGGNPGDRLRGPATTATAGPRTSAAASGERHDGTSWAATASSRARSRTTAATTST